MTADKRAATERRAKGGGGNDFLRPRILPIEQQLYFFPSVTENDFRVTFPSKAVPENKEANAFTQ